jgi:hypothetical protein
MSSSEHKLASINFTINRLQSYPISKHTKATELGVTKTVLQNNQYKHKHTSLNLKRMPQIALGNVENTNNGLHLLMQDEK